jgi:hypothetical protein
MVRGSRRRSDDSTTSVGNTSVDTVSATPSLNYRRPYLFKEKSAEAGNDPTAMITSWTDSILQSATGTCWVEEEESSTKGQLAPPWTDWLESGIEFFAWEGDGTGKRKRLAGRTMLLQQSHSQEFTATQEPTQQRGSNSMSCTETESRNFANQDYAKLHDEFFESLLKEQEDLATAVLLRQTESRVSHAESSVSSGVSSVSSGTMESGNASNANHSTSSVATLIRHKPLKLHRLSPRRRYRKMNDSLASTPNGTSGQNHDHHHYHARVAPIEAYNQMYNPAFATKDAPFSIPEIVAKSHRPDPAHFLHPQCLLQKDKGRGEGPKTSISAVGYDSCLEKLRDKMRLVVQVSGEERKASVKRRFAKVSCVTGNYVETRSMIELQLGFLSMQYGLLLQWDVLETGKVVYICLRKMCHDSFYSKIPEFLPNPSSGQQQHLRARSGQTHRDHSSSTRPRIIAAAKQGASPPLVVRSRMGNHAIYQRSSGSTEVVLVDPPYRIPHPDVFAPSVLTVDIHQICGLDKKSQWTLSVTFDGHTEIAHLRYNGEQKVFETTRTNPCKWDLMSPRQMTSFDVASLEFRLFEQRAPRRKSTLGGNRKSTATGMGSNHSRASNGSSSSSSSSKRFNLPSRNQQCIPNSLKPLKKSISRLASTMTIPLGGLVSQPCTSQTTLWRLTMPFTHDERSQVTFSLMHQSDYAHWLYQELRARRKEVGAASSLSAARNGGSSWKASLLGRWGVSSRLTNGDIIGDESDDDDEEIGALQWGEWLCGTCIK